MAGFCANWRVRVDCGHARNRDAALLRAGRRSGVGLRTGIRSDSDNASSDHDAVATAGRFRAEELGGV